MLVQAWELNLVQQRKSITFRPLLSGLAEQQWSFTGSPAPAALTLPPDGGCINAKSVLSFLFPSKQSRKLGNWAPTTQLWDHRALLFTSPVSDSYFFLTFFWQHILQTSLVNIGNLSRKIFKKGNKNKSVADMGWAEIFIMEMSMYTSFMSFTFVLRA